MAGLAAKRDETERHNRAVDTARRAFARGAEFRWTGDGWATPSLSRPLEHGALLALWVRGECSITPVDRSNGLRDLIAKAAQRPAATIVPIRGVHDFEERDHA